MRTTPPGRVLVVGCGGVGGELAHRLAGCGSRVWGLRRTVDVLPPGVVPLAGDLTAEGGLPTFPPALDAVVFTAAPDRSDETGYRAVYVEGLRRTLERVAATGARPRILFSSSTAVYGQAGGEWVDETSPTEPASFRGRLLLEAERILGESPHPGSSVRFGGIYGPGRLRLVERARSGPPPSREPPRFTNRIHRDDAARALEHLLRLERLEPVVVAVDEEPAPIHEVLDWLRAELGLPSFAEEGPPPTGRAADSNKRVSSRRLRESGFRFRFPSFREGYRDVLAPPG